MKKHDANSFRDIKKELYKQQKIKRRTYHDGHTGGEKID